MNTGNNTTKIKLLTAIAITLTLLCVCITVDDATNQTVNETGTYILPQNSGNATTDGKIYEEKPEKPTVTMWAKPSVYSSYSYKWYQKTFIDYCPHCHKYNVLYDAHKWQARYEHEWTCRACGADYCAVTGKEKYSWSHYYLTKA